MRGHFESNCKVHRFLKRICLGVILILLSALAAASEDSGGEGKSLRRSSKQWFAVVSTWREESLLTRNDGENFRINTLNTVGRIGLTHYLAGAKYFLRYGLVAGQSQNGSAVDYFAYYQRSVFLTGVEAAVGWPFFLNTGAEMALSLGGIYRMIDHTLPSSEYQFSTQNRTIPVVALEYLWRLSSSVYWRQAVGTSGTVHDTFWTAGLGYDW